MSMQQHIEDTVTRALAPEFIEVINESGNHNVPPGSESHFRVTVVSHEFVGKRLIERHRQINALLADELAGSVHALALHTLTPDEWFDRAGKVSASPPCQGGGAH